MLLRPPARPELRAASDPEPAAPCPGAALQLGGGGARGGGEDVETWGRWEERRRDGLRAWRLDPRRPSSWGWRSPGVAVGTDAPIRGEEGRAWGAKMWGWGPLPFSLGR